MTTSAERALLERYQPLVSIELRRIGVSEADEAWIHAGSDGPITESRFVEHLAELRALPTDFGVVAYCARLGLDYEASKRALSGGDFG